MADFDKLFSDTESYINEVENLYLKKHLADPTASPDDYLLDVKSYSILSHAALEDYIETIAMEVMISAINEFTLNKKITKPIVSLMHFKASGDSYLSKAESEKDSVISFYEYTRKALDEVKNKFSKEIFNNHGVALKYMKQLLMPVAIDIPNNTVLLTSLQKIANERGAYAHKFREKGIVRKSISPEDARTAIKDCLVLCTNIRDSAKDVLK